MENLEKILKEYGVKNNALTSIRKAFAAGRLQGISEAEGVVPEEIKPNHLDPITGTLVLNQSDRTSNYVRLVILDNLAKLKGKE